MIPEKCFWSILYEDVHERLKVNLEGTQERLDHIGKMFWSLTRHMLHEWAEFHETAFTFELNKTPLAHVSLGMYHLISKKQENISGEFLYRLSHPLGEYVIHEGTRLECSTAEVVFDISKHPTRIAVIEKLKGQSGWMSLQHVRIDSFDSEEYLLFSGIDENGHNIDQEVCEKLFNCHGYVNDIEKSRRIFRNVCFVNKSDISRQHWQKILKRITVILPRHGTSLINGPMTWSLLPRKNLMTPSVRFGMCKDAAVRLQPLKSSILFKRNLSG
jgi:hypothetical protein